MAFLSASSRLFIGFFIFSALALAFGFAFRLGQMDAESLQYQEILKKHAEINEASKKILLEIEKQRAERLENLRNMEVKIHEFVAKNPDSCIFDNDDGMQLINELFSGDNQ